jgi:hypothetical protein
MMTAFHVRVCSLVAVILWLTALVATCADDSNHVNIDTKTGLITIFLVQHAGFPGDGGNSQGVFRKMADELFTSNKR